LGNDLFGLFDLSWFGDGGRRGHHGTGLGLRPQALVYGGNNPLVAQNEGLAQEKIITPWFIVPVNFLNERLVGQILGKKLCQAGRIGIVFVVISL